MDYIKDKALYKAVMFARLMIRKRTSPQTAIYRAAKHYNCNITDVAHYVGQAAAGVKHSRRKRHGLN